jgi:spoIIIJ-associated protein
VTDIQDAVAADDESAEAEAMADDLLTADDADDDSDDAEDAEDDADDDKPAGKKSQKPTGAPLAALEREGDIAADYLEGLLEIVDIDYTLDIDVEGQRALVSIVEGDLNHLVGPRGEVLEALQDLTRLAVTRETGDRSRLMLDIAGYRADKRTRLAALAREAVEQARSTNAEVPLAPMSAFERKIVHDAVAEAGLTSESEGVEPKRRVVVLPTPA